MALKKLTSLLVVFSCRFTLFLIISLFSCILQGIPNINSCFLTIFLSCVIPLPPALFLLYPFERLFSKVLQVVRAYTILVVKAVSFPYRVVTRIVLFGLLENILRYFVNHIRFTIPKIATKVKSQVYVQLSPWMNALHYVIRMNYLAARFVSRVTLGFWKTAFTATFGFFGKMIRLPMFFVFRKVLVLQVVVGVALVCAPGLEPFLNLLATGSLYPGSLIRFQRCAKYDDGTACHAMFLEFSYSVWNLTRTGIFIMMCWTVNRPSWKPPKHDLGMIMERCLALNNKAYSQLLLCAAGLPLLMNGHCLSQTVHNITCTANLLLFLVTLNGYHSRTILMLYYVLCTIVMNAQSVLVAVYNMYRNLQTERNDYVATLLYITELYLMLLVLADSSSRAINKVKNPELDIMSQLCHKAKQELPDDPRNEDNTCLTMRLQEK